MRSFTKTVLFLIASRTCSNVLANPTITIDDQLGDPTNGNTITYKPEGAWSTGVNCSCEANPDLSHVYKGTWTWTKYQPDNGTDDPFFGQIRSASVPFFGKLGLVLLLLVIHVYASWRFHRFCASHLVQLKGFTTRELGLRFLYR